MAVQTDDFKTATIREVAAIRRLATILTTDVVVEKVSEVTTSETRTITITDTAIRITDTTGVHWTVLTEAFLGTEETILTTETDSEDDSHKMNQNKKLLELYYASFLAEKNI